MAQLLKADTRKATQLFQSDVRSEPKADATCGRMAVQKAAQTTALSELDSCREKSRALRSPREPNLIRKKSYLQVSPSDLLSELFFLVDQ